MLLQWLKSGMIFKDEFYDTEAGTPQGGIISPCLARLALNGLETQLKRKFKIRKHKGEIINPKVNTIIYADDFIISGISRTLLEEEVLPEVRAFMEVRGLELSPEKTVITHISEGFDFLGQNARKYKGKLLIKPSKINIKAFLKATHDVIRKNGMSKQEVLIRTLNPKIQGWVNYHRHVVSKETFSYIDNRIFKYLWNWSCRRHSNKSKNWIKNRYFQTAGNRHWVFAAITESGIVSLTNASDTKIMRHTKIRGDANPYAKEWETYFEEREGYRLFECVGGRRKLARMWRMQKGICPICNTEVTKETGWRFHEEGTTGTVIHPECHELIHGHIQNLLN